MFPESTVRDVVVLNESMRSLERDMAHFREEFVDKPVPLRQFDDQPKDETMRKWVDWWRWRGYYNFRIVWHPLDRRITLEPSRD